DLALPICSPEAERARPRQARAAAPMEGAVQLLSREGHTVSHNSKRHYHDAFVAMSRMRQRGLLCDIVLHVAAKEIRAHKVVLASCSPYFHAMFTNEMSESRQTHVTLHDIDPQALDQLVQFAYTAEIVVGEGNVQAGSITTTETNRCVPWSHPCLLCPSASCATRSLPCNPSPTPAPARVAAPPMPRGPSARSSHYLWPLPGLHPLSGSSLGLWPYPGLHFQTPPMAPWTHPRAPPTTSTPPTG
ncbi:Kelch-like protein 17, partial [Pteropus alecto]